MPSSRSTFSQIKTQLSLLLVPLAIMWAVECVNFMFGGGLVRYGIIPHSVLGLRGIVFAPFLHGSFAHLIANSLPYITLGWLVMLRRTSDFIWVSLIVMMISGFGTWLIAPSNSVHVGASGAIFGYLGFLISRGYFERRFFSILLSIAIGVIYGGLLWGVLPGNSGISWQGHLFGFIGGIVAGRILLAPRRSSTAISRL
jgi:membrane associated rhomboid family serine protease